MIKIVLINLNYLMKFLKVNILNKQLKINVLNIIKTLLHIALNACNLIVKFVIMSINKISKITLLI